MSKWENLSYERKKSLAKSANTYVKKNCDRIHFNVKKGTRERWLSEANTQGYEKLSQFIIACVERVIESGIDVSKNDDTIVNN